jgi:uncharacterized CHY-type Zn-finger protein
VNCPECGAGYLAVRSVAYTDLNEEGLAEWSEEETDHMEVICPNCDRVFAYSEAEEDARGNGTIFVIGQPIGWMQYDKVVTEKVEA